MAKGIDIMELFNPNLDLNPSKERQLKWSLNGEKKERLERN